MAITQLQVVKELSYLVSNAMSLLTCVPMAIGILIFGKFFDGLFENRMLKAVGVISYGIYLVHAVTLGMIKPSIVAIVFFIVVTGILAYVANVTIGRIRNGELINYYPHKE